METLTNRIENESTPRRGFIRAIAGGAAALGLTALASPLSSFAQQPAKKASPTTPAKPMAAKAQKSEADIWFDKVKGSHRVIYDCTRPNDMMPFAWPRIFLL